jgi:hypothetical protein
MATPINTFKTFTAVLTSSGGTIYTAPQGITSIILLAHLSNVVENSETATVSHVSQSATTELVKDFAIPGNDAASVVTGKLVLETGNSIYASAGSNNAIKIVLSVLETRNV